MDKSEIQALWEGMSVDLNEKQKRRFAATLSKTYGYGGSTAVHEATGIALNTITRGKKDLSDPTGSGTDRIREPGAGRPWIDEKYPRLMEHIEKIIEDSTYGDPMRILTWTTDSLRTIQEKLLDQYDEKVSYVTIGTILEDMDYSKQQNQKMLQNGEPHPDRDAQFQIINKTAKEFIAEGEPVISVDTKKKENVGNFKNGGREYRKVKDPRKVLDHDFPTQKLGKIAPYGVYCQNDNTGFVNVGTSKDTAEFAVGSIFRWWHCVGKHTFPNAKKILITCDSGGSNGCRIKLWKYELSKIAKQIGLDIYVSHFPPGTSKWNKIEHRLFCYISKTWEGKPLIDVEAAVKLIGSTVTSKGLRVICKRDDTVYESGIKVSDDDFDSIPMTIIEPLGLWNYVIHKS